MTPDQQREQGKLMMEAADHPEWRFDTSSLIGCHDWLPLGGLPSWDFSRYIYRRRPEPTIRPWTAEEARGKWVHLNASAKGYSYQVTGISETGAYVNSVWESFSYLLENATQPDGSPAGVEVKP